MSNQVNSLRQHEGFYVFGDIEMPKLVPLNRILVAGQMRAAMDEHAQKELANSISQQGQDMPVVVSSVDLGLAIDYVKKTNECWGTKISIPKDKRLPDGTVNLLTAGHRRYDANVRIAKKAKLDLGTVAIKAYVRTPGSIMEIMNMQSRENLHSRPPALQFARIVQEMYSVGRQIGVYKNVNDFLQHSPLKEHATRDALMFFTLPAEVQKFVEIGELSYTIALEMARYQVVLQEYNIKQYLDSVTESAAITKEVMDQMKLLSEAVTNDQIKTFAMSIIAKMQPKLEAGALNPKKEKGWSSSKVIEHIKGKILDLRTTEQMQMSYFNSATERATAEFLHSKASREKVLGGVAVEAVYAAQILIRAGVDVPRETRQAATTLARKHGIDINLLKPGEDVADPVIGMELELGQTELLVA